MMTRGLFTICQECRKSIEAIDVHKTSPTRIAELIRDAEKGGWELTLSADNLAMGCECEQAVESSESNGRSQNAAPITGRLSIRQLLYMMTVVAVLLAIFRHPIQLLFDQKVWQAIVAPWTVYGWLFWGGSMVAPPNLKASPMAAIAFTISTPVAVLTGFFGGWGILKTIGSLWERVSQE